MPNRGSAPHTGERRPSGFRGAGFAVLERTARSVDRDRPASIGLVLYRRPLFVYKQQCLPFREVQDVTDPASGEIDAVNAFG
jgi:hypothetical protein